MNQQYSHFTHRHNFAIWAAARASQRGFPASVSEIKNAVESSGLPKAVEHSESWPLTDEKFDSFHRRYCREIIRRLKANGVDSVTYGRAAKIVAVYLKSMIVVGEQYSTQFARVIHPPLDRILLRNLSRRPNLPPSVRQRCERLNWTELPEDEYFELIEGFRQCGLHKPAFWMLEQYWKPG